MRARWILVVVGLATACASAPPEGAKTPGGRAGSEDTAYPRDPAYVFAGSYIFPGLEKDTSAPQFSGISGLAPLREGQEMLAVSDDREQSRVYRIAVEWKNGTLTVKPLAAILLQPAEGAPRVLDPEGIAISRDGHLLIASEGAGNVEPRLPPAIIEYAPDGRFIRQLPVRPRYTPNARGPAVTGARENAGFESLAITDDFSRLYTATELPLFQDGAADPFLGGAHTRILEYVASGNSYEPAREFAYELSALERPPFEARFAINGVVELLRLEGGDFLLMERGFAESADRRQGMNRIRVFRVSLEGATDVSGIDSLTGARFRAVRKTLVLDVNTVPGLDPRLAHLDNFEGMTWGPAARPGGARSLVLVSDDNQNPRQVTAFLLFERRM